MYRIHSDVSITRRKRYLIITDEKGETVFRAKTMLQILRWMDGEEQNEYMLCLEAGEPVLHCKRLLAPLE